MIVSEKLNRKTSRWLLAFVLLCAIVVLPFGIVYAAEPDYEAVGRRLIEAVKAGELTPEQAQAMMGELARARFAQQFAEACGQRGERGSGSVTREDYARAEAEMKRMVRAGKISEEDMKIRLNEMRRMMGGEPGERGREDSSKADYDARLKRIKIAVERGDMTREEAAKIIEDLKRRMESAERTRGGERKRISREDYARAEAEMKKMVRAGKISEKDMITRLGEMRRMMGGGENERSGRADDDARMRKFREMEVQIYEAVKAGKMSREDAHKKIEGLKKKFFGGENRKSGKISDTDALKKKYRAIEEKIWAAVKAGKMSEKDAKRKLEALKKEMWPQKKTGKDSDDARLKKYREIEAEIFAAVRAGKMSREDAGKKIEALKKRFFGGENKKSDNAGDNARIMKYRAIEAKMKAAVKAGKMTEQEAKKKLEALRRELWPEKKTDRRTRR